MSGFKLLGIRPLKHCDKRFRKNLNEGEIYKFYNDYEFVVENEVVTKVKVPKDELDLYSPSDSDLKINISAVVGKNGSGKSSLIELLFVAVYLLALDEKILDHHDQEDPENSDKTGLENTIELQKTKLKKLEVEKENIFDNTKEKADDDNFLILKKKLNELDWNKDKLKRFQNLKGEISTIRSQLRVEVFYQVGANILCLTFDSNKKGNITPVKYSYKTLEENKEDEIVHESNKDDKFTHHFFYSLVLNYSQYALNSREIGDWVQELFHKNDAYQTPIVINPMRTEGKFDINTENDLVRQRLLANILTPLDGQLPENSMRQLAQGHIAYRMSLRLKEYKFRNEAGKPEVILNKNELTDWNKVITEFGVDKNKRSPTDYDDHAKVYIFKKLKSIAEKYEPYYKYIEGAKLVDLEAYLKALKKDDSHIAYKFHQAINFLKCDYATTFVQACTNILNVKDVSNKISKAKISNAMHTIPPSFFEVEVYFDEGKDTKKAKAKETNTLQNLSSGEKQHVYAISSIMYHLRYLDSVKIKEGIKHKYEYINLIFDEIELYYHPELQRSFINDLLEAIKRCNLTNSKDTNGIKSINCIFITHSPFILSDIPSANILKLKDGKSVNSKQETFAANIHDMLASSFFLDNGFMGEFVKEKIKGVIKWINDNRKMGNDYDREEIVDVKKIIAQIEEPVLRNKLTEMLSEIEVDEDFVRNMIEKQTAQLKAILKRNR